MHSEEPPNTPPTEGQTVPPEEQILPTGGIVQEQEEPSQAPPTDAPPSAASQAQSLAQENPMPIALAAAFVAGVVVGRILSR